MAWPYTWCDTMKFMNLVLNGIGLPSINTSKSISLNSRVMKDWNVSFLFTSLICGSSYTINCTFFDNNIKGFYLEVCNVVSNIVSGPRSTHASSLVPR